MRERLYPHNGLFQVEKVNITITNRCDIKIELLFQI